MKNFYRILICILLVLATMLSLIACRDPYIEPGTVGSDYDGVSIRVTGVDYSGDHIKLNVLWSNATLHEVTYGADYTVERYEDGEWVNCMRSDAAFIEIAYVLSPISSQEKSYSLQYVNVSREGMYRIRTTCYVYEGEDSVACSLFAIFKIDNKLTIAGYHSLGYNISTSLYEELRPYYKAGETVTVKVSMVYDLGFVLYVNGEELQRELETEDYWQYSFIMPDGPVRITSMTYDGNAMAPYEEYIRDVYCAYYPGSEFPSVACYYGEYDGAYVALLDTPADDALWSEEIEGFLFRYHNGNGILVFYEDDFCNLSTALKDGILTVDDISAIYTEHVNAFPDRYSDN